MSKYYTLLSELIESNGFSVRENNLNIKHTHPIGFFVYANMLNFYSEDLFEYRQGCYRVLDHTRDCDGTPLYTLTYTKEGHVPHRLDSCSNLSDLSTLMESTFSGFGEDSLSLQPETVFLDFKEIDPSYNLFRQEPHPAYNNILSSEYHIFKRGQKVLAAWEKDFEMILGYYHIESLSLDDKGDPFYSLSLFNPDNDRGDTSSKYYPIELAVQSSKIRSGIPESAIHLYNPETLSLLEDHAL